MIQLDQNKLQNMYPEMTEEFSDRMYRMVHTLPLQKEEKQVKRASFSAVLIAAIMIVAMTTAAFAATQWGVFDKLGFMLGELNPKADSVMQEVLHQETINGVEITIKEAGYDGKTLFIQYSYRMPDVEQAAASEVRSDVSVEDMMALDAYQVGWWIDHLWINGQCIDMPENSGSVVNTTSVPGELEHTEYWRLDNVDVDLSGEVEISLPIGEKQPLSEYRKAAHPEKYDENGTLLLPEKGMVTFTLDSRDTLEHVITLNPNVETVTPEVTAKVTEAVFTPLMTYITLDLKVNPDAMAAFIAENGEGYKDENGKILWPYGGMDVFGEWILSLQLVDGNGTVVFPDYQGGQNGYGNDRAEFLYPYMECIPVEQLYLAPVESGTVDMSQAVLVKPSNQ